MQKNYNRNILDWERFPEYDMIWTSPPWNESMNDFFIAMMKKDTRVEYSYTLEQILEQLAKLAERRKPMIIEYGKNNYREMLGIMDAHGHKLKDVKRLKQDTGGKFFVFAFNSDIDIAGKRGAEIITKTLDAISEKPIRVFDPFAGIGITAKAVIASGNIYIGSEINIKRYEKLCQRNI